MSNKKPAGQLFSFVFCRTPSILRKISPTQPTKTLSATFRNDSLFRKAYHTYITFIKNAFASGCGLPLPQRQRRFLSAENNKRKEKRGKMRRERKKMREEKREKDKGREKEGQKTTKSKMEKVISSPQPQARRRVFGIQKTPGRKDGSVLAKKQSGHILPSPVYGFNL